MKKIGILFGQENTFPQAFVERVNAKAPADIRAEFVRIDQVEQHVAPDYAVIIDRISQDVPFYRAYLKNAALMGTAVINNPFWWSADEKFFNNALAVKIGVPVPKTALLPSFEHPTDTNSNSFRNLKFPMAWEEIFEYTGWPAYMKPHAGGGWKNVYKLNNLEDFYRAHGETNQLVMMLQEEIQFSSYYRCYCIGQQDVLVMPYEPRNPHHLRYQANFDDSPEMLARIERHVRELNIALGYDFNTVEFAVRDGVPYAIDFCNPAPDADVNSVGEENFNWVVEAAANMAIRRAQAQKPGQDNLTWGTMIRAGVSGETLKPSIEPLGVNARSKATATPAAKAAAPKAGTAKAAAPKAAAAKGAAMSEKASAVPMAGGSAKKAGTKKA